MSLPSSLTLTERESLRFRTDGDLTKVAVTLQGEALGTQGLAFVADYTSATTIYLGSAQVGSETSEAVWQIKEVTLSATGARIRYAGGVNTFTHIWDNRGALSYE